MHRVRARLHRSDIVTLSCAVAALVIGGLIYTTRRVMWIDEVLAFTIVTEKSWTALWTEAQDIIGSVPLYYVLGHGWGMVFGYSEFSLRLMSMFFMVASMVLLWLKLRRYYSGLSTAIGVTSAYFLSSLILYQNVEIRFYGVHIFVGSLMLWAYDWVAQPAAAGKGAGKGTFVGVAKFGVLFGTSYAWAMLHLYGMIFSGMALLALCVVDLLQRRIRPLIYTAVPLSWVAFYFSWHTQLDTQQAVLRMHGWFAPRPNIMELFLTASAYIHPIYLAILLMFVVATILEFTRQGRVAQDDALASPESQDEQDGRTRLVVFATLFAIVPMVVWVLCQLIAPAYVPRYMIPVIIGYAVVFTHLTERSIVPKLALPGRALSGPLRKSLMVGYLAVLMVVPVLQAFVNPRMKDPSTSDASVGYAHLPAVFEHAHDFVPRAFYAGQKNRYYYVLDADIAVAKLNSGHAANDYVILENLAKYHPELYNVVQVDKFLREHDEFLVFHRPDNPGYRWIEMRLMNRPDYTVQQIGTTDSSAVYRVQRKRSDQVHAVRLPAKLESEERH